ncbi:hypothetical protein [Helicobacter felistomachi]|uniref:hypothetical protein n=1 Tax=Helicobacter felistomachi TaxID=3040201 RepID=UPI002573FA96|nr:hypothetical protein [Helicobacter sp. NHP21005]
MPKIDQYFPSSQICGTCGSNTDKKPLRLRNFVCPCCQTLHLKRPQCAHQYEKLCCGSKCNACPSHVAVTKYGYMWF